jgi:hypothetical protein
MKKILTIISLVAVTTLLHAQGYIEFYGSAANIQTNTAIGTFFGGPGTGGTSGKTSAASTGQVFDYILLYETTALSGNSAPTNSAWSPVLAFGGGSFGDLSMTNNLVGTISGPSGSAGQQVNLASTSTYSVELVGWTANLGTFANVLSVITAGGASQLGYYLGWTTVGSITPFATPGAGDPTLFANTWSNGTMVLNQVAVVPEPASIALAGLGGLSLLLFRRRK